MSMEVVFKFGQAQQRQGMINSLVFSFPTDKV